MGTRKLSELIISIVLFIAGAVLFISSQEIEVGAAMGQGGDFMPKLCSVLWLIISGLLTIFTVMNKDDSGKEITISLKGFFATLILLIAYVTFLKPIGFVITSILYMFVQMLLFVPAEYRTKKNYMFFLIISIIIPVAVNALFVNVFSLILPTGVL